MKKSISLLLSFFLLLSFSVTSFADSNNVYITKEKTPVVNAVSLYEIKLGADYRTSPTPPAVTEGCLFTVSGRYLYKINSTNGEIISKAALPSRSFYAIAPVTVTNGKVFVQLDGGIICAYEEKTLKKLWTYTDTLGGQALSPIVYSDGFIYTGFWNGEDEKANFVCLSEEDTAPEESDEPKNAVWTYSSAGGFYCVRCVITKNAVLLGKDNGTDKDNSTSRVTALDKINGNVLDSFEITGDVRCGISYNEATDSFYTASKAGAVCKFTFDEKEKSFSDISFFNTNGFITATPVSYKNRLYVTGSNGSKGKFFALDAYSLTELYSCELDGYPQGDMLISAADESGNGKIRIYFTLNSPPGGIIMITDSENNAIGQQTELFLPDKANAQYCISPVICGNNGTLYYKNDSGCIFAVKENTITFPILEKLIIFFEKLIFFIKNLIKIN